MPAGRLAVVKVREGVETKDRRAEATRRERETREVGGERVKDCLSVVGET